MIEVRVNKASVKRDLSRRVDEGQRILDFLAQPGAIDSYDKILEVRKDQESWSKINRDILGRRFSGDSLLAEYDVLGDVAIGDDLSWQDEINLIRKTVDRKISWLRNLIDKVDDLPQSAKTPSANWERR